VVKVDAGRTTGLSNTASVASSTTDTDATNNSATEPTAVQTRADLSITKSDSPDPVTAGNNLTYTITVTNVSTAANGTTATGASVSDSLPANTSFVSVSGSAGVTCTETAGSISCTLPNLGPGGSATITYVVKVNASFTGPSVSNTANVAV